jgi:AcrR family transcriptional regulator
VTDRASSRQDSADSPSQRRPYQSPLREERAVQTRDRIVAAARELFASQGFAATTVAMIAKRAGVAAPTVYATVGSKAAIVGEMIAELEAEVDRDRWGSRILAEPDPRRKLALYASFLRSLYSNGHDMWAAAISAATDPAVVELHSHGEREARLWLVPIVDALDEAGELAEHLSRAQAVERAWMLTALELYFRGTTGLGWTDDQYESWLAEILGQQLIRRVA